MARFLVAAALGGDYHGGYGTAGEKAKQLAVSAIRLVIEAFRTDVTKTKTDGTRGASTVDYGDQHKPADAIAWMWRFIDGARSAAGLYGRALVVIAAEQYASRLVVPSSQQQRPLSWSSHKDQSAKALAKLAGSHLPASLKQLEQAIAKANVDYDKRLAAIEQDRHAAVEQPPQASDANGHATGSQADESQADKHDGERINELEELET
ncbi:MAG: hypothetical protein ACP5H2_06125 [Solirubrobacteraceae bacterium]